jgi:hypothetical protein
VPERRGASNEHIESLKYVAANNISGFSGWGKKEMRLAIERQGDE